MKLTQHAYIAIIVIVSGLLPSCMMPDPMFSENVGMIQSVNYPSSRIVGRWASFSVDPFPSQTQIIEDKTYYDICPEGHGRVCQSSKNKATGNFVAMEADFRWKYLGANTWKIMLPPSSEYKVTDSKIMTMGSIGARELQVRYYKGNLYEIKTGQVWVPANSENISNLANRVRQKDPVIVIPLQFSIPLN